MGCFCILFQPTVCVHFQKSNYEFVCLKYCSACEMDRVKFYFFKGSVINLMTPERIRVLVENLDVPEQLRVSYLYVT
jgi:hypothetical protein